MNQRSELWSLCATQSAPTPDSELDRHCRQVLASDVVATQRSTIERVGLRLGTVPMLWKYLPGPYLRLFLPVTGNDGEIDRGTVVAVVLLHDPVRRRTIYAHPVHAGPDANPTLKHIDGPMAAPKAQPGRNGDLATRRLLEHKRALWDRFEADRDADGPVVASRCWRAGFQWALVRLYFCERCAACRWGSPYFEGADGEIFRPVATSSRRAFPELAGDLALHVQAIVGSDQWQAEVAYVRRGRFAVDERPRFVRSIDGRATLALFSTDAEFLQGGEVVGLAAWYDSVAGKISCVHILCAGPEPEVQFLFSDRILGLPSLAAGELDRDNLDTYVAWRRVAWSRFWLDELESGIHEASRRWLDGYWEAIGRCVSLSGGHRGDG